MEVLERLCKFITLGLPKMIGDKTEIIEIDLISPEVEQELIKISIKEVEETRNE